MTEIIKRLQESFPDADRHKIEHEVTEAHREYDGRPIRDFVPVLVEREAVERLGRQFDRRHDVPA